MSFYTTFGARCVVSWISRKLFKGQRAAKNFKRGPCFQDVPQCLHLLSGIHVTLLIKAREKSEMEFSSFKATSELYPNATIPQWLWDASTATVFNIPRGPWKSSVELAGARESQNATRLLDRPLTRQLSHVRAQCDGFNQTPGRAVTARSDTRGHREREREGKERRLTFLVFPRRRRPAYSAAELTGSLRQRQTLRVRTESYRKDETA